MNLFAKVAFAAPSTEFPAMSLAVVHFAAEPVVFAALFGMSPETSVSHTGHALTEPVPRDIENFRVVVVFPTMRPKVRTSTAQYVSPSAVVAKPGCTCVASEKRDGCAARGKARRQRPSRRRFIGSPFMRASESLDRAGLHTRKRQPHTSGRIPWRPQATATRKQATA